MLFLLILGVFEGARYVLFLETLNNATREGSRFAIVNGGHVACPSGPMPDPADECDSDGDNVVARVEATAAGLATMGELVVHPPVWTSQWDFTPAMRGDPNTGYNTRGDFVSVFVDYSYNTVLGDLFGIRIIPPIKISAESSLVVNY
jgi:hypothetical protein